MYINLFDLQVYSNLYQFLCIETFILNLLIKIYVPSGHSSILEIKKSK